MLKILENFLFLGCPYYTMLLSHPEIHFFPAIQDKITFSRDEIFPARI